jgi:hypothetical protein
MIPLSDKTNIEFNLDFSSKQVILIQKGELGVEVGRIAVPMEDLKKWGSKFKGLASFIPGLTSK